MLQFWGAIHVTGVATPRVAGERHEAARDGGRPATAVVRSRLRATRRTSAAAAGLVWSRRSTRPRRLNAAATARLDAMSTAPGKRWTKVDGRGKAGRTQDIRRNRQLHDKGRDAEDIMYDAR